MPEWWGVTGAISVVAIAAGIVSGPSLVASPAVLSVPSPSVLIVPGGNAVPVPLRASVVPPSQAPPIGPPALRTAPARPIPADAVPGSDVPPLEVIAPTTGTSVPVIPVNPCPIGLELSPILGVCVSI